MKELITPAVSERFWAKVLPDPDSDCLLWYGARIPSGYGIVTIANKQRYAHRVSFVMEYGDIDVGKYVLHRCDVRNCVNPQHLYQGTPQDNTNDMMARARHHTLRITQNVDPDVLRQVKEFYSTGDYSQRELADFFGIRAEVVQRVCVGIPARSHLRPRKLLAHEVLEIRRRYAMDNVSTYTLAKDFGVSQVAVWQIVTGNTYKHLLPLN